MNFLTDDVFISHGFNGLHSKFAQIYIVASVEIGEISVTFSHGGCFLFLTDLTNYTDFSLFIRVEWNPCDFFSRI